MRLMSQPLLALSNQLADAVARIAPSVVQVHGRRAPASGLVFAPDTVLTTFRALGRENGVKVRSEDGRTIDAEIAGWDLTTHLAVLRAPGLNAPVAAASTATPRVGHLALAVGRSWSNALTASAGIVAVIGGPLPTGRGRAIDQVIRTTAPMHKGFAGGAFVDVEGHVIGVGTAAAIRGLAVVIPAGIAWKAANDALAHGRPRRGYLGLSGQQVQLAGSQQEVAGGEQGLIVLGVLPDSPAAAAGLLTGDVILSFDATPVANPETLLDLLVVGKIATLRVLRGEAVRDVSITVGEKGRL